MSSLPASMKKIRSKMKALEWTQHFPHYISMVAMETSGPIWPNFELIQALIHVLITCKYEKNLIKNSGENVMTSFSRYGVNSYSSQFVLKSIRTHFSQFVLSFRSIRTHLIKFSQLVLILVDSYSVWSIRTHTKI